VPRPLPYRMHLVGHTRSIALGVQERIETQLPDGARLEAEAVFADQSSFREHGTLEFVDGSTIHLRTLGSGQLTPSVEPGVNHGTVTWDIDGGSGRFADATGRISSSFTVTPDGQVDDEHIGLIFLGPTPDASEPRKRASR
jgi:hypothetical protein